MGLTDDLERVAASAVEHARGATLAGVLPAEASVGVRRYVCAFASPDGTRAWLVVDDAGRAVADRRDARDALAISALCELAAEAAFPGDLDDLRAQLVALRLSEAPDGIEAAEEAAHALQLVLGSPPTLATPGRLDEIGRAARRLEEALDPTAPSPFVAAMRGAQATVDELWREVEGSYGVPFTPPGPVPSG